MFDSSYFLLFLEFEVASTLDLPSQHTHNTQPQHTTANNQPTNMPALARQNSVRPQASAAATDDGAQDPAPVVAASGQPLSKTWSTVQHFLKDCQPLAGKLDANDTTKTDRKAELKRLAEHAAGNLDEGAELTVLMIISAETVKSYCAENAENSVDKYCGSACAWLGLISTAQGHDDMPAPICRELAALESLSADTVAKKQTKKPEPQDVNTFFGAGVILFNAVLQDYETMKYADLALAVWCILTTFGIPARARTFRTVRWGENIKLMPNGDWMIRLGDPQSPGTKHRFPVEVSLSDITSLGTAGLARPDMVCVALGRLLKRTKNPEGRLVFSRSDTKDSMFGKDVFGRFFAEKIVGLKVEELRTALESRAAVLLDANAISPRTRSLATYLQQHKAKTAGTDYVRLTEDDVTAAAVGDSSVVENADDSTSAAPENIDSGVDGADSGDNGNKDEDQSRDTKKASILAKSGDIIELTHDYNGDSNMLVTVEDGNLILELIKKSHNSDYNWSFAPHREGFKHHVVHIDEHGVNQVCISPSPDLSSASLLELVVNFGPDGVELVQVGESIDGDFHLHTAGHVTTSGAKAPSSVQPPQSNESNAPLWLKEVIETAEEFKYDNCRTPGDIIRYKLVLARAALKKPAQMSFNESCAWSKYNELVECIDPTPVAMGEDSSDESEIDCESDGDDSTAEDVLAALRQGFVLKPRARRRGTITTARKTRRRTRR